MARIYNSEFHKRVAAESGVDVREIARITYHIEEEIEEAVSRGDTVILRGGSACSTGATFPLARSGARAIRLDTWHGSGRGRGCGGPSTARSSGGRTGGGRVRPT